MAEEDKQVENAESEFDDDDARSHISEIDPDAMEDGNRTVVVGEWSIVKTIAEGLEKCYSGDTLLCSAGDYDESVTLAIDSLEIRGPVEMSAVIKQGIVSTCSFTTVTTMCIEGGVEVKCGNLSLTECDISNANIGLKVHRMTIPTLKSCTFHDLSRFHICVYPGGNGEFIENTLTGSSDLPNVVGVYLDNVGTVILRKNQITDVLTGIYTISGCKDALLEENTIFNIQGHAIYVDRQSKPTAKGNEIKDCGHYGVLVSGNSAGAVFSKNVFYASIRVREGCRPSFYDNIIVTPNGKVIRDDEMFVLQGITYKPLAEMLKKKKAPNPEEGEEAG